MTQILSEDRDSGSDSDNTVVEGAVAPQPKDSLIESETPLICDDTSSVEEPAPPAAERLKVEVGEFKTLHHWTKPTASTCHTAFFAQAHTTAPKLVLGLNKVDLSPIVRLRAAVRSVDPRGAHIELAAWSTTAHYGSGCAWLAVPAESDIQCGRHSTWEDWPFGRRVQKKHVWIAFARPFAAPPRVVAWLDALDACMMANVRACVWADGVTREGFTLHLSTWADSRLWQLGAGWLAYPADRTDVRSGAFHTESIRPAAQRQHKHRGHIEWEPMTRAPRVFAALSMLDFEKWKNLRVQMQTSEVSATGMVMDIDSWHDTVMHKASAVYVAFDD
ncbi:hypothetical protein PsYK624_001280 [Phanerochaete sordida]|uniref:H-type lectin domain-containing protein n=1 Tax=Phanerochaete sordida TaxID=48140 RepID=A0A9P3FWV4_9APHY|nr:hypothetical protein PsYK624_001280 [Phanerochaete sordida]